MTYARAASAKCAWAICAPLASEHSTTRATVGHLVYGGSALEVIRGGIADLLGLALSDVDRIAVHQALRYHTAALHCFNLLASRCNYDIVQGRNGSGQRVSGVLEQSWRIGGASAAEIAALHRLLAEPDRHSVSCSTHEVYGDVQIPARAWVSFRGTDAHGFPLTKYVEIDGDERI
jgi:hypothetical protein